VSCPGVVDPLRALTYDRFKTDKSFDSYQVMSLKFFTVAFVSSVVMAGVSAPLFAQSLGDIAKKEEERRHTVKQPAKVYTNKDLGAVDPGTPAPPPDASKPAPATAAAKEADKDKTPDKDKIPVKDQAYWSGRVKALQAQADRDQTYADAMQSRINALTADFAARDDPAQRSVISSDRQKAVAELGRLKVAIQTDKKALADLQEEARRASVPPGWLR
jgi:hypothetical protein